MRTTRWVNARLDRPLQSLEQRKPQAFGRLLAPDNQVLQGRIAQAYEAITHGGEVPVEAAKFVPNMVNADVPAAELQTIEMRIAGRAGLRGWEERILSPRKLTRFLQAAFPDQAKEAIGYVLDRIAVEKDPADSVHALCVAHARCKDLKRKKLIEEALRVHGFEGYRPKFRWCPDTVFGMVLPTLLAPLSVWLALASSTPPLVTDPAAGKVALAFSVIFGGIAVFMPVMGMPYRRYALMTEGKEKPEGTGEPSTATRGNG